MKKKRLEFPPIGLGTWKTKPGEINRVIREAIAVGVRHFDCSPIYENEKEIGKALNEAIKAGDIKREDLFITSKLWNNKHEPSKVQSALYESLDDLQLYYMNLYLMHWPIAFRGVVFPQKYTRDEFFSLEEMPLQKTWAAMVELKDKGIIKHIGVSNFSISKLKQIIETGNSPEVNQIENHPYLNQEELVEFCKSEHILVTAYKPLGSGKQVTKEMQDEGKPALVDHPTVLQIAEDNEMDPAQVLLAWQLSRGISVIPKSSRPERIKSNFDAQLHSLTPAQIIELNILNWDHRYVTGQAFCEGQSPYTVEQLWA